MSDLVWCPEDRFSRDATKHWIDCHFLSFFIYTHPLFSLIETYLENSPKYATTTSPATKIRNIKQHITSVHDLKKVKHYVKYQNDPKFSDRSVWANSSDPDQKGAVWSGSSLFAIPFASFWQSTLRFGLSVWILGRLQQSFMVSENLGTLQ